MGVLALGAANAGFFPFSAASGFSDVLRRRILNATSLNDTAIFRKFPAGSTIKPKPTQRSGVKPILRIGTKTIRIGIA
jgi:hypothetical protein